MNHELEVTKQTITSALESLRGFPIPFKKVQIHVLLNGLEDVEFRNWCNERPEIIFACSQKNLGVAGGRNFLLKKIEEESYIYILDNDIYLPRDYFFNLYRNYNSLSEKYNVGLVGASVLNFSPLKHLITSTSFTSELILNETKKIKNPLPFLYHLGIDPDWQKSYHLSGDLTSWIGHESQIKNQTRSFEEYYKQDYSKVSNVIGASQIFRHSLYKELNGYCDSFNPYGFEDVDFCIKAMKKNYQNFVCRKTFLLHGTDERHKNRLMGKNQFKKTQNNSRALFHLFINHATNPAHQFLEYLFYQTNIKDMPISDLYFIKRGMNIALKERNELKTI